MPEGDTIFRTARTLDRALGGRRLVRFEAPRLRFRPFDEHTVVEGVDAAGKHCLIRFDDGRVLRSHMQMTGSWHLYRPGERWQKKPAAMRALVEVGGEGGREVGGEGGREVGGEGGREVGGEGGREVGAAGGDAVDGWVAVCFAAPVVELVEAAEPVGVEHLGPDLCRPDAAIDAAVARLRQLSPPERPIGEALLDQRIAAGIGNIYKNEACFAEAIDPRTAVGLLDDAELRCLLTTASRLLRKNLANVGRTFGQGGPMVYGRRDRPCGRCGTTIAWVAQGEQRRGTYWCPTCQPARCP